MNDQPCDKIENTNEVYCGSLKPSQCKDECQLATAKKGGCVYVSCKNAQKKENMNFCLPVVKNKPLDDYKEYCKISDDYVTADVNDECNN